MSDKVYIYIFLNPEGLFLLSLYNKQKHHNLRLNENTKHKTNTTNYTQKKAEEQNSIDEKSTKNNYKP